METARPSVDDVFDEAISRSPGKHRTAYLDEACGGDSDLRQRVERLLRAFADAGSFLESPAVDVAVPTDSQSIAERPGILVGPYKLLEQIGEGGMGVVYMAEQQKPVRRRVALKIIKPGMGTRRVIARFEAERQALALMDHPNIAKVLDAGTTEAGRPYFVMELVQGVPITEYCDQYNLTTAERLELFIAVCQAVQHAHQKGVIHRDIKPTNVLVAMQDGQPTPKVIDFGVAKAIDQKLTEQTLTTAFAQLVGSPLYMSPEQAELSALGVDTRSDIYSLGVLLYELLIGTTPFDKDRLHAATFDEFRRIIREEEPPRPSARVSTLAADLATTVAEHRRTDARRLRHTLHGDLDWIVMKCLEKDRNRRYDSAGSLARDIERYLHDEPVQACPPSIPYRLKKFIRRNRIAAAFVALLLAAVAALTVSDIQTRKNERRAVTESAKATAVSGLLQDMLSSADAERAKGIDYTVRELLDDFSASVGSQLANQPEAEADIHATIGRAYRSLRLQDQAQPHFENAIERLQQMGDRQSEKLAEILVDYGWNLHDQHRFSDAESRLREALEIYRKRGVTGGPVIHALRVLQHVLISFSHYDDAELVTHEAMAIAKRNGNEFADMASILHRYAELKIMQGRFAEAEQLARQSVDMHRRLHGDQHPETAWGLTALAAALRRQQKLEEAETAIRESLVIFRHSYPEGHDNVSYATNLLASILESRGDQSGLEKLAKDKAEQATRSEGPNFHVHLAELLLTSNPPGGAHKEEAHRLFRRAIDEYGQAAVDSPHELDRRLESVRGYAEVARICAAAPDFVDEIDEVNRRLKSEYSQLLATFTDRVGAIDTLYTFALARLRQGDEAGYRQACEALVHVPDGIGDAEFERVWAWCLHPDALEDLSVARKRAEELVARNPKNADYVLALGGVLYRDGQYARAGEQQQKSISAFANGAFHKMPVIDAQLLLAMTKWQQGEQDEARGLLAEIQSAIDKTLQGLPTHSDRRAALELLRREAEALIGGDQADEAPNNGNPTRTMTNN